MYVDAMQNYIYLMMIMMMMGKRVQLYITLWSLNVSDKYSQRVHLHGVLKSLPFSFHLTKYTILFILRVLAPPTLSYSLPYCSRFTENKNKKGYSTTPIATKGFHRGRNNHPSYEEYI